VFTLALESWGAFAKYDHGNHDDKKGMGEKMEPMFKDKDMGTVYRHYST
jgi:hypothetical protein